MILLYLSMGIVNCKNIYQNIKLLKFLVEQSSSGNNGDSAFMLPQLKLKLKILIQFLVIIFGYFLFKVIVYLTVMVSSNEILVWKFATTIQAFDIIFFLAMLFVFRPRVWPQFYSLGINELANQNVK